MPGRADSPARGRSPTRAGSPAGAGNTATRDEGSARVDDADPLAASWRPEDEIPEAAGGGPVRRSRPRQLLARYGWRIYAVPLLALLTGFALVQSFAPSVLPSSASSDTRATEQAPAPAAPKEPVVTAPPPQPNPPEDEGSSAELPAGPPFPTTGARTFEVLPGESPKTGSGELHRYTVETEVGVDLVEGDESYARLVQATLADPRSWTNPRGGGLSVQRVGPDGPSPDFRVILISQQTAREMCGYSEGLPYDTSCRIGDKVLLNAARWVRGAKDFHGDIGNYRRYLINHEVGHVFGNDHVGCSEDGALAPIMMQQTFSTDNNELHQLNDLADQGGSNIPADGKTCEYNAWPFPRADAK
ncbi:DUF3152 domain-containing protein [Salinifilum ghardaiensis]